MLVALIVFVVVGTGFVIAALLTSRLLRPSNPTEEKLASYECGAEPFSQAWRQINVHYYIFAIMFVLFDVEAAFLFPIALVLGKLRWFAFAEVVVFVVLLFIGWIYASRVGGLEWER
jgi:NADH-quinone oxidoreductase subunit A